MVISDIRQLGILLVSLDTALHVANRLAVYVEYLHSIPSCPELANFESRLVALYATVLQFLAKAINIYGQNTVKRVIEIFLDVSDVEDFEMKCRRQAEDAEIEAQNCDRMMAKHNNVQLHHQFHILQQEMKKLDKIGESMDEIQGAVSATWLLLEDGQKSEILQWISTIPCEDNHRTAYKGHVPGTGDWIFQNDHFRLWDLNSSSVILWLHGNGKCKNMLLCNANTLFSWCRKDSANGSCHKQILPISVGRRSCILLLQS